MLSLDSDLLSDFFLDLLESFQKELLDLRSLIEHDLSKGSDVLELPRFVLEIFSETGNILSLLLDDLFVLEFEQFLLLFKIVDDLLETLFEDQNLFFEDLDLFLLQHSSGFILILGFCLD